MTLVLDIRRLVRSAVSSRSERANLAQFFCLGIVGVVFGKEAVDGVLKLGERAKDAASQSSPAQLGEEALDRVEP